MGLDQDGAALEQWIHQAEARDLKDVEVEGCQNLNQHRTNHLMSMFSVILDCKPEGITGITYFYFRRKFRS